MSYVTLALVQSEFKDITFTSTTAITDTDVIEFILQEEAALNGQIGTVYSVPVVSADSPVAFAIMKLISTLLIKDRIEMIIAVKTGSKVPDQGDPEVSPLRKKANDLIEKIIKKEMTLVDATLLNSTGGAQSYNSINALEPVFLKATNQW